MLTIVEMRFGSHLYGTNTPSSDLDIKAVHVPPARDLLLQRTKPVYSSQTKTDPTGKNSADDRDFESYSLQKYLTLVSEGQTVALDMLFAPDWAILSDPHPLWLKIRANTHRLLSRKYASFVGYCRQQSNKYGIRGSRVAAARLALNLLDSAIQHHGTTAKLGVIASEIGLLMCGQAEPHMGLIDVPSPGAVMVTHWDVCGRKMPYTSSIKNARDIMVTLVNEYGKRALQAEANQGVDWKALSHAVRIGRQAIELLSTGSVTFPRPDAEHLLAIKTGRLTYQAVADEIETLLAAIEGASAQSDLPDAPDRSWIDEFVVRAHLTQIRAIDA